MVEGLSVVPIMVPPNDLLELGVFTYYRVRMVPNEVC